MKAYAFTATFWICPDCHSRPYYRDVAWKFDEIIHIGPESDQCSECGRCLDEKEAKPVKNGGLLRGGWWFTCRSCLMDHFIEQSAFSTDALGLATERPPSVASCMHCGAEHEVTLPD